MSNFINVKDFGYNMKINYNGLWKILINKRMHKKDLAEKIGLAPMTISKMGNGEFVSLEVLYRIGIALDVDFADMISIEKNVKENADG